MKINCLETQTKETLSTEDKKMFKIKYKKKSLSYNLIILNFSQKVRIDRSTDTLKAINKKVKTKIIRKNRKNIKLINTFIEICKNTFFYTKLEGYKNNKN